MEYKYHTKYYLVMFWGSCRQTSWSRCKVWLSAPCPKGAHDTIFHCKQFHIKVCISFLILKKTFVYREYNAGLPQIPYPRQSPHWIHLLMELCFMPVDICPRTCLLLSFIKPQTRILYNNCLNNIRIQVTGYV